MTAVYLLRLATHHSLFIATANDALGHDAVLIHERLPSLLDKCYSEVFSCV